MLLSRLVGRSSTSTPRPRSAANPPRRSVWDAVSALWRDRLSSDEKELLGWMARAGSRAHIINEPGRPRHVCIGGRPLLQFGDDVFRTRYVRALERELRRRELVSTFNGVIYDLTAKGWAQAQRLR